MSLLILIFVGGVQDPILDRLSQSFDDLGPDVKLHIGCLEGDWHKDMQLFYLRREFESLVKKDSLVNHLTARCLEHY